jgi:crotonobetainyl-CoA:carnitine CoA-transferase CaiB-like acyl-CoA transferase
MRSAGEWAEHPQGAAVAAEAIVARATVPGERTAPAADAAADRPLAGVRVLDLTRVIAGPIATRTLSAFGADVVRIDPVGFEEVPSLLVETTAGKRCAALDLRDAEDRARFEALVDGADVLVHGYRPGALAALGYGPEELRDRRPGLIIAGLCAYGWTGPWAGRRGFDSLVQMSSGIADAGGRAGDGDRPGPLPAQALDHGTGYLLAAAAVRALTHRRATGETSEVRLSLARTARALADLGTTDTMPLPPAADERRREVAPFVERASTAWGPVDRVRSPVEVAGTRPGWAIDPGPLGVAPATW